jgi:hypothetical protein
LVNRSEKVQASAVSRGIYSGSNKQLVGVTFLNNAAAGNTKTL